MEKVPTKVRTQAQSKVQPMSQAQAPVLVKRNKNKKRTSKMATTYVEDFEFGSDDADRCADKVSETTERDIPSDEAPWDVDKIRAKLNSCLGVNDYDGLRKNMEAMKSTKLSIAVMGPSCVGKSSFINNMLGLKEGEPSAATIGDGDTTQIRTAYSHPQIKQLEYYDLPGFGTPFFKMTDEYLREIKVESYDFFLIFYSGTISEGDKWIIQKLLDMNKMFALVRTRADEMKRRAKPLNQSIMEAKDRCETNLREFGIKVKVPTFIISNIDINIGEMNKLFRFIQSSLPELKRKAITLYVQAKTDEIIAQKEEQLLDNAWVAALCMGVATGLPLPGVDIPINYVLLGAEIKSCLLSFGLSAEMFERLPEDVKMRMKTTSAIHKGGVKGYILLNITKIPTIISCALVQEAVEICLPVVGSLITGSVAFVFYLNFLRSIIRKLANEARILRRIYLESVV